MFEKLNIPLPISSQFHQIHRAMQDRFLAKIVQSQDRQIEAHVQAIRGIHRCNQIKMSNYFNTYIDCIDKHKKKSISPLILKIQI